MAVAFDAEDRERITACLLETAERLFAAHGVKKTSLEELVAPAGIAKSSFYAFFDSKEALYLEVMVRRAPLIGASLARAADRRPDTEALVEVMRALTDLLSNDPFYRRLLSHPDELRAVSRRVGEAEVARVNPYVVAPLVEFLRSGQRQGLIVDDLAPEILISVLRTVGLVVAHREDYGATYGEVLEATIRTLAVGLTKPTAPHSPGGRHETTDRGGRHLPYDR